jgi:hypothetical protein
MPEVDDNALAELLRRTHAEIDNPVEYSALTTSKVKTPDGTPLDEASLDIRTDYTSNRDELASYVDIGNGEVTARAQGTAPPAVLTEKLAKQWDFVIREIIADRHFLANYLQQHYRGLVIEQQARIKDLESDAAHQQRAFAAVKQAIADTEYAEKWTGILLKINEAYDALAEIAHSEIGFDPALVTIAAAGFAREQVYGTSQIIEQGVRNLGNYAVALELASAGYGSTDELNTAMASTMRQLGEASDLVEFYARRLAEADAWTN